MNETLINCLQKNRTEKVKEKRGMGKNISTGTIVDEKIPQEEKQPDPSTAMQQFAWIIEWG